ncbi:hypothetical protein KAX02_03625 [candidate division WOR-3 bacterium]|nr:hypothetical protein [candidate division WOR-3 bacterium]
MNGDLREAEKKLKEMAMKHDMGQNDCYDGIRHMSLILLGVTRDMRWIKLLIVITLAAVLGVQGIGMAT